MLAAVNPRQAEAVQVAATRLGELEKLPRGNRKTARELNALALSELSRANYVGAVLAFEQAAKEDAGDVEIQANLGQC